MGGGRNMEGAGAWERTVSRASDRTGAWHGTGAWEDQRQEHGRGIKVRAWECKVEGAWEKTILQGPGRDQVVLESGR